jgi:hypothetical protein
MNIILLHGEWMESVNFTSFEIGIRHKVKNVYKVVDKPLFMLSVIKYGIMFMEVGTLKV